MKVSVHGSICGEVVVVVMTEVVVVVMKNVVFLVKMLVYTVILVSLMMA